MFQRVGKVGSGKRFDRWRFLLLFHVLFKFSLVVTEIGLAERTAETHSLLLDEFKFKLHSLLERFKPFLPFIWKVRRIMTSIAFVIRPKNRYLSVNHIGLINVLACVFISNNHRYYQIE